MRDAARSRGAPLPAGHPGGVRRCGGRAVLRTASVIGSRRSPTGSLIPAMLMSGILAFLACALLLFSVIILGMWGSSKEATIVYVDEKSPGDAGELVASENDPGSMGSVSSTVTVRRDLLGIFRLQRRLLRLWLESGGALLRCKHGPRERRPSRHLARREDRGRRLGTRMTDCPMLHAS